MRIGLLAREAGVGIETVRFYERRGLIERPGTPRHAGFRDYPPEAADRIRFIRQAQDLGFSLKEIEELLSLRADPSAACVDVRARAETKREEVERKIEHLVAIRRALEMLIEACPGTGVAARHCSILEALEPERLRTGERIQTTETA